GTQGGDVEQRDPLSLILANYPVQGGKDCRLSLPRARWRDYEYVLPLEDQRGGQGLRRCRLFYARFPQQSPNGLNQVVEARVTAQKRASRGQRPSGLLSDELEEEKVVQVISYRSWSQVLSPLAHAEGYLVCTYERRFLVGQTARVCT